MKVEFTAKKDRSMKKYIDAEKLVAEIDGMLSACTKQTHTGVYNTCHRIKGIIASLLQEQPEPPSLTEKAIVWFNNIAESAKKLSSGNVSHLAPTIAGMAIRSAEFLEKRKPQPADIISKEEYVKRFKALCDAYEIKLPNREYDIYHLCNDLSKLFTVSYEQKPVNLNDDITLGLDRALQIIKDAKGILVGYQTDDGVYECDHAIQTLEGILKNGIEQQPAEWSEEDEKQLNDIIGLLPELTNRHAWLLDIKQRLESIPERFSLQPKQEQREVDLEKSIEFECIGKKVKMTVQELINYYIDSECRDVADECEF